MRRNLKVTMCTKTCLECLRKEYECLLNDKIPSRLLRTRWKVSYPSSCFFFFFLFWEGSTRCAAGFSPPAHSPDVGGSVFHWPEIVTYGPSPAC